MNPMMSALFVDATRIQTERRAAKRRYVTRVARRRGARSRTRA